MRRILNGSAGQASTRVSAHAAVTTYRRLITHQKQVAHSQHFVAAQLRDRGPRHLQAGKRGEEVAVPLQGTKGCKVKMRMRMKCIQREDVGDEDEDEDAVHFRRKADGESR